MYMGTPQPEKLQPDILIEGPSQNDLPLLQVKVSSDFMCLTWSPLKQWQQKTQVYEPGDVYIGTPQPEQLHPDRRIPPRMTYRYHMQVKFHFTFRSSAKVAAGGRDSTISSET